MSLALFMGGNGVRVITFMCFARCVCSQTFFWITVASSLVINEEKEEIFWDVFEA